MLSLSSSAFHLSFAFLLDGSVQYTILILSLVGVVFGGDDRMMHSRQATQSGRCVGSVIVEEVSFFDDAWDVYVQLW